MVEKKLSALQHKINELELLLQHEKVSQEFTLVALNKATYANEELTRTLSDLYDEQNGPPLFRHEKGWHQAMKRAKELIQENWRNSSDDRLANIFTCPICKTSHGWSPSLREGSLHDILKQIINDLPSHRDWLDPALEKSAKELLRVLAVR